MPFLGRVVMGWYAIYVKTGKEDDVCLRIEQLLSEIDYKKQYRLLVPKRRVQEKHQGVYIEKDIVLFPGYVLVETEFVTEFYHTTKACKNLYRFLKNGEEFQEIALEEISEIVYMVDEDGIIGISDIYIEDDIVEVTEGPLCNYFGWIKKIDKHKRRAKVLFMFKGQNHLIDLSVNFIRKPTDDEIKAVFSFYRRE